MKPWGLALLFKLFPRLQIRQKANAEEDHALQAKLLGVVHNGELASFAEELIA